MKKVLVVDDEPMLREVYEMVLEGSGYEVVTAQNGFEAMDCLETALPDLILLDLLMPGMNGLEFLMKTNIKTRFPQVKIIAFSNLSRTGQVEEALKLGAQKHFIKSSLSPAELLEEVEEVLG
jgi:CheY-like chemotaxis protein